MSSSDVRAEFCCKVTGGLILGFFKNSSLEISNQKSRWRQPPSMQGSRGHWAGSGDVSEEVTKVPLKYQWDFSCNHEVL